MKVKFLGQGLNEKKNNPVGKYILKSLKHEFNTLKLYVAFMRVSGLNEILENLIEFNKKGEIKMFIGIDLNGTSKEALELLINNKINTSIVYSPNTITYHPKIYLFENEEQSRIILGSSNLTSGGLYNNVEASLCIDLKLSKTKDSELLTNIKTYYNSLEDDTHESCQILTEELLHKLIEANLVISEKQIKQNISFNNTKIKNNSENIKELFKSIKCKKVKMPSSLLPNKIKDEEVTSIIIPKVQSMWMQTKKLTGGSGNILDLAMTGNLNGEEKIGPSEFFEVKDRNIQTNITLHFNNSIYENNIIKYATDNGSWRLQLKGISKDKLKFTENTKKGSFKNKIIQFTKMAMNEYSITLLEESELDNLKRTSDWGYSGKRSGTKLYGFIHTN